MGSSVPIAAIVEIIATLMSAAFDLARKGGLSADEVDAAFSKELDKFLENDPSTLPDL